MAVVPWVVVSTPHDGVNVKLVKWAALGASDTGQPFNVAAYSDKSIQVEGDTLTSGVTIQGSLDPDASAYRTLNDPQGTALAAIATASIKNILEHCYLVRPSGGASVANVTVWLLLASTR